MNNPTFTNGWLLPKGINVEPQPVLVPNNAASIASMINCDLIDVIHNDIGSADGDHTSIVGYVDDEGLLKEHNMSDMNHLAMHLFNRDHPLIGDVIVVGALNSDGDYDGHNYDLPEWVIDCADVLVEGAAERYNAAMGGMVAILTALKDGVLDADEFMASLEDGEGADKSFIEQANIAVRYTEMMLEDEEESTPIVDGFEKLLEDNDG